MIRRRLILALLLCLSASVVRATDFDYEITSKAWCDHKCGDDPIPHSNHKAYCVSECISEYVKVQRFTCEKVHSPSDYCGVDCQDNQCEGIDICCNDTKGGCGLSCFTPDLSKYLDFPPIPTNVTVYEAGRMAMIQWDSPKMNDTIYIIQERHYTGCRFSRYSTTGWASVGSLALEPPAPMPMKNGTWYEVRVAAVSANGTRGFSHPSKPFRSPAVPSPPQTPLNLRFSAGGLKNTSLWGVLSWQTPPSDLPIKRYTVTWSKRLVGDHTPKDKIPLVVQRKTIDARKTFLKIRNLQLGHQYFLQVEAQSLCGKKRLLSERAGQVLNLTDISSFNFSKPLPEKFLKGKTHLTVSVGRITNTTVGTVTAKVSWNTRPNAKYVVSWRDIETSDGTLDNHVVQTGSNIELTDLQYRKTYTVKITEKVKGKKGNRRSGKVVFVADPACKKVKRSEC